MSDIKDLSEIWGVIEPGIEQDLCPILRDPRLMQIYHNVREDIRIRGPIRGDRLTAPQKEALKKFRSSIYERDRPYLNDASKTKAEEKLYLDQRSHHFFAFHGTELVGALRSTPRPFEIEEVSAQFAKAAAPKRNYLEISRLIVCDHGKQAWAGPLLLFGLLRWAILEHYEGVLAMCRKSDARKFRFFGLTPLTSNELHLEARSNQPYVLLCADWSQVADRVSAIFGLEFLFAVAPDLASHGKNLTFKTRLLETQNHCGSSASERKFV